MAILVFLLPLVVVGAVKAKGNNRNDVKGWLPLEYPETQVYRRFRQSFQGEEFVLASWEGCTMADPRLELLARKLLPPPEEASRIDRPLYFKTAQTGPRAVAQMTAEPLNLDREAAIGRLTGALVGPPPEGVEPGSPGDDLAARQTCLVLTLSEAARANLHGAIDLVKGVAVKECGIPEASVHMGGPPVDNVSIDKAGQTSVTVLFGLSLVVGGIVHPCGRAALPETRARTARKRVSARCVALRCANGTVSRCSPSHRPRRPHARVPDRVHSRRPHRIPVGNPSAADLLPDRLRA